MEFLNDTQTWALILGLLTPFAQSLVQRPGWSTTARLALAVGLAAAVGLATVLAAGDFSVGNWFATAGLVLAAAQTAYGLIYKPAGVTQAVEVKTSPGSSDNEWRPHA